MFPVITLLFGIFIIWIIATGKAYQIVQVFRAPIRRGNERSNVNSPNVRSSGSFGGKNRRY